MVWLKFKQRAKRKPFAEPLTEEEHKQVQQKAYAIWKARNDDGKASAADDWHEAIEQAKVEQSFSGKQVRNASVWLWKRTGLKDKTLWDLLQVFVVPLTLALASYVLQTFAKYRDEDFAHFIKQRDEKAADEKAKQDTLVKYLSEMSDLLQNGLLRSSANSEKVIIAQAKTVTVLQSLDAKRQHLVIQFLEAANLNTLNKNGVLYKARLSKADLMGSDLSGVFLIGADLDNAKLGCLLSDTAESDRMCVDLSRANLRDAILTGADLSSADLTHVDLSNATLENANLSNANLSGVNLSDVDLRGANLDHTILIKTDLSRSRVLTNEQLLKYSPYFCETKLPHEITIDPSRDCKQLPQILYQRYPNCFKTVEEAQRYIDRL